VRLAELWRYPVKSLAGEGLHRVTVNRRGLEGDRLWALVDPDGGIASAKTTRRFRRVPGLLHHRSHLDGGVPVVTVTAGRSARVGSAELDALVSEIAPPGWSLQREDRTPHFDAGAVHLVTTATLATLSEVAGESIPVERLRPNLLLEVDHSAPFPEDEWLGLTMLLGAVELRIVDRTERCAMVGHAQSSLEAHPTLLKTIGRINRACAGVYAEVSGPGVLNEGDIARLSYEKGGRARVSHPIRGRCLHAESKHQRRN
jgi:uncharacterized protein YcbX